MAIPVVAIVGRPNVGKSSLFNALAGARISIVDPMAGVTRDRVSTIICQQDRYFELLDTGGYGIVDSDALEADVESQIFAALNLATVVLFVVDVQEGLTSLDEAVAALLRRGGRKVILLANKADTTRHEADATEFMRLGFGQPICTSAVHNVNKAEVLDRVISEIEHLPKEKPADAAMKIAIVGKRNAGKSTLVNAIAGQERVIVSEVPGTTRDSVDVRFEKDGKTYIVIDTAGVRKKGKMESNVEFYGYTRAERSVREADVVLFVIDASVPVSQVDKKLAHIVCGAFKAVILVVNKWDLAKGFACTEDYGDYLDKMLTGLGSAPIAFTTATEGKNVQSVLDLAGQLYKQASRKISTGRLNRALELIRQERGSGRGKAAPRLYYATQVSVRPVSLLLFVNRIELFDATYQRYLVGRFGELLGLEEVPIRLLLRGRARTGGKRE